VQLKNFETTAPHTWDSAKLPLLGSPECSPSHPNSVVTDWSVDADEYGYFLSRIFDEWRRKDFGRVLVNHFETLVAQHLGLPSQICIYNEFCGKGVALEHDGSVYSCDHYVYPEYRLGTLQQKPLGELVFSPTQAKFGYAKSDQLPRYCRECPYLTDCWGECPKNRLIRAPDGEHGLSYLCAGLKRFYRHALPEVERICANIRARQQQPFPSTFVRMNDSKVR
jgi:serine-type anaerobic sulfatase-maturating enzyme